MSIVVNAPAPVSAGVFAGARATRGPGKAQARIAELIAALSGLTPLVDNVGPSITVTDKYVKSLNKAKKALNIELKVRPVADQPNARQVWVKGPAAPAA